WQRVWLRELWSICMSRRWIAGTVALAGVYLLCASASLWAADDAAASTAAPASVPTAFDYAQLVAKAKQLAAAAYKPQPEIPKFLRQLDPAAMADIRYKPAYSLWRGDERPFEIRFYHPGSFFVHAVGMNVVNADAVYPLAFSPQQFTYPSVKLRNKIPPHLGYAGIKILHQLNSTDYLDEVASFLGASYFRALPRYAHYGLSARGLAINTASN